TVTLIPNGIHHPPIEDGRLLPNSVKKYISYYSDFLETIKNQKKYSPNSPSSFDFIYIMKSSYENYYFMFRQE
ncbi:hypothetical protein, partial [Enterococcus faecium]|uniref:hypothetical protein n=1 Tax=Enterococcus faecium TaxID=1352 RepID=UPI001C259875